MDFTLTMDALPAVVEIAQGVAARFLESAGCPGRAVVRMANAVATIVAQAAAEHPVAGCQVVVQLVTGDGRPEVRVSYPSGACGPAAADGLAEGLRADSPGGADLVEWRTEHGTRHCRLVCASAEGSR